MKQSSQKDLRERKERVERRLEPRNWEDQEAPMLDGQGIVYEVVR